MISEPTDGPGGCEVHRDARSALTKGRPFSGSQNASRIEVGGLDNFGSDRAQ